MPYNYSKLLGRIVEVVGTQGKLAEMIGLSERSVSLKLNGKLDWKQSEMYRVCEVLKIATEEISNYFFAIEVQKNEHPSAQTERA